MQTLPRDGDRPAGIIRTHEKLMIARLLLEDSKVDRVEVASARVSDGGLKGCENDLRLGRTASTCF